MGNIMSMLHLRNNVSRNGFDPSHRNAFTAKAGELLPVHVQHAFPNTRYRIKLQSFTRTQPLETSAFTRMKEYYDFYFVPYRLLWRYSGQFFARTREKMFAESLRAPTSTNSDSGQSFPTLMPHATMSSLIETIDGRSDNDIFGRPIKDSMMKLLHYLDYGSVDPEQYPSFSDETDVVNLMAFAAYQKIYFDFFRDSQWEVNEPLCYNFDYVNTDTDINLQILLLGNNNLLTLRYCNYPTDYFQGLLPNAQYGDTATVDAGTVSGSGTASLTSLVLNNPNIIMGSGDVDPAVNVQYMRSGQDGTFVINTNQGLTSISSEDIVADASINVSTNAMFSILDLRKAESKQRWSEITQSNAKDYPSQMEAHFGKSVPHTLGNMCQYIGGTSGILNINDVMNTNLDESTDTPTAQKRAWIKGKGTIVNNGSIDFEPQEHGIIMCIYHIIPLLDYDAVGVDPFNIKTSAEDFAIPEFDNIGMQPTDAVQLNWKLKELSSWLDNTILGYAPRYAEYKTAIDKVHGAFTTSLRSWYSPMSYDYMLNVLTSGKENWYIFKKVNPDILDSIFGVNADNTVDTDQFLVNSYFDVKCVLPLDRNGLPY